MSLPKESKKYTYADYLTWPEGERWEIINGVPYNMSPSLERKHQKVVGELFAYIHNYLKGKTCEVYNVPFDVRLLDENVSDDVTNVVQPDIVIVCDPRKLDDKGCKGSPDMIVEVVSPSTLKRDLKEKFYLYEKAGVKVYWIVFPDEKTVLSYHLGEDGKYKRPEVYSEEDNIKVGIFESLEIDLKDVFDY
ncbi:Uma2 family endonuclease [Thermohydrogenium kirishiense]|nr:Uma2 family endonuclease [Thermohydrogenium kirishiense]